MSDEMKLKVFDNDPPPLPTADSMRGLPLVYYDPQTNDRIMVGRFGRRGGATGPVITHPLFIAYANQPLYKDAMTFVFEKPEEVRLVFDPIPAKDASMGHLSSDEINNRLGYHKGTTDGPYPTAPVHKQVRQAGIDFMKFLNDVLPEGRAKILTMQHFETTMMWANKSVAEKAPLTLNE